MRLIRAYIELTKPRVTWLVPTSTGVGYYFGESGPWRLAVLFYTLLGTGLLASGTATLNEWHEREGDARMRRGALTAESWVLFGILFFYDYRRGGIVFLPVVEPDGRSTARQMPIGSLLLVPASLCLSATSTTWAERGSTAGIATPRWKKAPSRACLRREGA
jgi:heme O synthase-like polyprenyltransferase